MTRRYKEVKEKTNIPEQEAQQENRIQGPLSLLLAWTTLSSPPQPKTHCKTRLTSPRRDTCPKRLGCCCCMSREREMQSDRDPGAPLKEIESIFPEICSTSSARKNIRNSSHTSLNYLTIHCCLLDIACGTSDLHLTESL